ncbi:MAG: hypothetical protein R6X15_08870 [Pseudomonadota bacterium]
MNIFITGNSSGLGRGFSEYGLENGRQVYGCSRRGCVLDAVHDVQCDLADFESGSFVDIRRIIAPEEYEALVQARNRA